MTRILVIEDEEPMRANIADMLEIDGMEVISAKNGREGVQSARDHLPDLIICDIMMPELDGYGVLAELRQSTATATIPLIFLTARADRLDVRQGMDLGADDYLTKPFTHAELLKAVSTRLAKQAAVAQKIQARLDELRGSIVLALPHEMRTPLTSIIGFSEVLVEDCASLPPQEIQEMAQMISDAAKRLHGLILSFLLYAELEIAVRDPAYARALLGDGMCQARPIIGDAAKRWAQQAHREADLQVELQDGVIGMTEPYTQRIADEMISNAFKFSKPGTPVNVTGSVTDQVYTLRIQDHGRGMTAQQIAGVGAYLQFERKRYEQQGQGLGLIITKRLVELKGGKLHVESTYGQQTTVCITLPLVP